MQWGNTPLHEASRNGHTDVVNHLVKKAKVDVDATNIVRMPSTYVPLLDISKC